MGLDVYLHRCEDLKASQKKVDEYEEKAEAIWQRHLKGKTWDQATEDVRGAARKETNSLKEKMGLDEHGGDPADEAVRMKSKKYPDHFFEVGYFRSSYNGSGIDSYFRRLGLPQLSEIMGVDGSYRVVPDWSASKARALDVLGQFRSLPHADVDVMKVEAVHLFGGMPQVQSEEAARAVMMDQLNTHSNAKDFRSYSNREGHFFMDGLDVIGLMAGTDSRPCVYVAYRSKRNADDFYGRALEIIAETCDYVMAQPDPQNYYLRWSS